MTAKTITVAEHYAWRITLSADTGYFRLEQPDNLNDVPASIELHVDQISSLLSTLQRLAEAYSSLPAPKIDPFPCGDSPHGSN